MAELYLELGRRVRAERRGDTYRFSLDMADQPVLTNLLIAERDGEPVRWIHAVRSQDGLEITGEIADRWKITAEITVAGDLAPRAHWTVCAQYLGMEPAETAWDVFWDVQLKKAQPFVPGIFYGENRPDGKGSYPRWSPVDEDDPASSPVWRFRTDRTMTPFAMLRNTDTAAAVSTPVSFSHGESGLGFGSDGRISHLSLHFPWREEPVSPALFGPDGSRPRSRSFVVLPSETVEFSFEACVTDDGWRSLLRDMYKDDPDDLQPWISGGEAAELAADGLMQWHFSRDPATLYETAGFDRYFRPDPTQLDRPDMHIAWVSGAPYALALARYGTRTGRNDLAQAGLSVLDRIAEEGIAPAGMFYPRWTREDGWTHGWNAGRPAAPYAQSRTIAEATWFYIIGLHSRAPWITPARRDLWCRAVESNLDFALKIQRDDGSFGTYYHLETGNVEEWEGAGGLSWIPALLDAHRTTRADGLPFPNSAAYREAAVKAGRYYAQSIRNESLFGAPEDVPYGVTSEDGYNALIAMLNLYEEEGDEEWLELSRHAADYMLSFRMSYNTPFSPYTLLGQYDFRTKGGDIASPSNQHLHNYGLICLPELLRLWRITRDDFYFARARDHLFCFRQFIAREDGDFNARRGMVPEQWFHTDWTHPKGYILPLAHAWCAGWTVWIEDWLSSFGHIFIDPDCEGLYLLESLVVEDVDWQTGVLRLTNPWTRDLALRVVNLRSE